MAASSSSSGPFFHGREGNQNQMIQQLSSTTTSSFVAPTAAPQKKRRNQPATQNGDAEVIALSPRTLMAANRFICEVCNKGFQREQNLQLHRRGHNLPWKLKQKNKTEVVKRKVYLCPEPTCVHHDPSRALGDLTGIKKHYFRKHGEKKYKCEKCSKRYAVQSDWKAHSKTCGTREYRCDCGTLFSRRDSFITHRAFCDALAQESARHPISLNNLGVHLYGNNQVPALGLSQVTSQNISPIFQDQNPTSNNMLHLGDHSKFKHQIPPSNPYFSGNPLQGPYQSKPLHGLMQLPDLQSNSASHSSINLGFFPSNNNTSTNNIGSSSFLNDHIFNGEDGSNQGINLFSNNMEDHQVGAAAGISSLLGNSLQQQQPISPHMSATALLQKAAQMGSTTSNANASTLLRNLGSSSSGNKHGHQTQMISPNFGVGAKVGEGLGMQMENESQIQGFMDSLAHGGASFFGGGHGTNINVPSFSNVMNDDQSKLHQSLGASRGGNDDNKLTLDFLGVGGMMRKFGGHGANGGNPELKSAQPSHPF